jgi:hypothetical protein
MLRVCIVVTILYTSFFAQGADQGTSLVDCIFPESSLMFGVDRHYETFALSKYLRQASSYASSASEDTLLIGCIGIVEGADAALTEQVAGLIKGAIHLEPWDPLIIKYDHQVFIDWNEKQKQVYVENALQFILRFFSHYEAYDVGLSLAWFYHDTVSKEPVLIGRDVVLNTLIMPPSVTRALEYYKKEYPREEEQLQRLKSDVAKAVSIHKSVILHVIPERLRAFVAQELAAQERAAQERAAQELAAQKLVAQESERFF